VSDIPQKIIDNKREEIALLMCELPPEVDVTARSVQIVDGT